MNTKQSLEPHQQHVDFLIAGAQKGGTTALESALRQHPDVRLAKRKEVHFFDDDDNFIGKPNFATYHRWFDFKAPALITGEATPIYMYWRSAPPRIFQYNPKMRLILLLRNPIERAYSHWNMEIRRAAEHSNFGYAIRHENERCQTELPRQHRIYSYVDRGFYSRQIKALWQYFSKEQTLILKSEWLLENFDCTVARVLEFLGIENTVKLEPDEVHAIPYAEPMVTADRDLLRRIYEDEIGTLEQMLAWDCSDWR